MHVVDFDKAVDLVKQAIALKGADHVQVVCNYLEVDENGALNEPGCVVGTALYILDKDALIGLVGNGAFNGVVITNNSFISYLAAAGITITADALDFFFDVQAYQDGRRGEAFDDKTGKWENIAWGEALRLTLEGTDV